MKTLTSMFLLWTLMILACNNEARKDSVEKADSANKAKLDSPVTQQAIITDEETSSFLVKAANGGMTEVKLGELAQQKAANQKVKDFAAMMVKDHSTVNDEVKALATVRNLTLPTAVSDDKQKEIDECSKKSGAGFDRDYVKKMVAAHQETIDMYKKAADNVKDSEVKTFINNTIPKVQQHLDSAKSLQKTIK